MEPSKILSFEEVVELLRSRKFEHHANYLAMYSTWWGGIVTDPALMMVPLDDHLVHRGDGIFEAFKCVAGNVYNLDRHLDRLQRSAAGAQLTLPMSIGEIRDKVLETIRAADSRDCLIRLYISRGPGGFSTNPYECVGPQFYVHVGASPAYPPHLFEHGATLKTSAIPIKKDYFANIKSCNYLPNVLMTKEAKDAGVDYVVSLDEEGYLGEGPTENVSIITKDREFLVPRFDRILQGTTISRVLELARPLADTGELRGVRETTITPEQAYEAAEIVLFGTTFDSIPVVSYDGRVIGEGKPGPNYRRLRELLMKDIHECTEMLTPEW